jgi:hypothetical protein
MSDYRLKINAAHGLIEAKAGDAQEQRKTT